MEPRNEPTEFTGILLEGESQLSLAQVSRACAVHAEWIVDLVTEGILTPAGGAPNAWRFTGVHLRRVRIARRLQDDLGVNLPGVALALQLLDEIEELRAR